MTVIVCQECDEIIDYADSEKVDVLYGKCPNCRPEAKVSVESEMYS